MPAFDLRTNARVLARLVGVRVRLWRDPAAGVRVGPAVPVSVGAACAVSDGARVAAAVERWSRVVPRSTCLVQAITTQELLAERGHASVICFGVTRVGGALRAHAWVELDGVVLVGGGPQGHTFLGSLDGERATRAV